MGNLRWSYQTKVFQSPHKGQIYSFVLKWSLTKVKSAGVTVIPSATAPLHEIIITEENGILIAIFV
jgi:hypothetical protein